jgi:hypothetical protein
MKKLVFALILLVGLSGCSVLNTVAHSENQLAIQYATFKVLKRDDVSSERLSQLISTAKTYVSDSESVTINALVSEARRQLYDSSISVSDQMLIEAILARAQERLEARLGYNTLDPDQRVELLTVLGWIESAANGYRSRS